MCPSGIDEFPAADERTLREGMKRIAELDSILLVHAEDPADLREPRGPSAADFIESRPVAAEVSAIEKAIEWAAAAGCRLHIVHVSTVAGAELIIRTEHDVSGETCPHYMLYVDRDMARIGGTAKCAPPFRAEPMAVLPIVVSDHSPSTLDLKLGADFRKIWGGISGCQSTRQLLLAQELDPRVIVAVTSTNVARRFGLQGKGDIAPGFDADLWIVDPGQEYAVRPEDLLYKNKFSAHEGQKIRGRSVKTLVRGRESGRGRFIRPGGRS
jgi:allantoinase